MAFNLLCSFSPTTHTHTIFLYARDKSDKQSPDPIHQTKRVAFVASSDFNFVLREFAVSRIPSIVAQSKIMQSETISLERCNLKYLFWGQCWGTMPAKETSLPALSPIYTLSAWCKGQKFCDIHKISRRAQKILLYTNNAGDSLRTIGQRTMKTKSFVQVFWHGRFFPGSELLFQNFVIIKQMCQDRVCKG